MAKSRKRGRTTLSPSGKRKLARGAVYRPAPIFVLPAKPVHRVMTAVGAPERRSRATRPRIGVTVRLLRREAARRTLKSSPLVAKVSRVVAAREILTDGGRRSICRRRSQRREAIFANAKQGRGSHGSYRRTPESKEKC